MPLSGAPVEVRLNAISGPASSLAVMQVWTNAPVRPVRAVTSNAQRATTESVDRYEPSAGRPSGAGLTYSRTGAGGHVDADGDLA